MKILPEIEIKEFCKLLRENLDLTQQEMADKIGVTLRTYQYWENGKWKPRAEQMMKLIKLYYESEKKSEGRKKKGEGRIGPA